MASNLALLTARRVALPATIGAGGAAYVDRRTGSRRQAAGAAGGAALGEGVWRGVGYGIVRPQGKKREGPREGQSRSQYQKLVRNHKKAHGMAGAKGERLKRKLNQTPEYFRTYPKELNGWQYKRILGHMSGDRGKALQATLIGSSAIGGALLARSNQHGNRSKVGKALYERERHTSPVRLAEASAGAGLLAWGVPRTRVVGRALARGIKQAEASNSHRAVEALQRAQALQGVMNARTGRGASRLRQIQAISDAVDKVPVSLRPAVATTAGALLMHQAHPVRQTRYRNVPVRGSAVTGW